MLTMDMQEHLVSLNNGILSAIDCMGGDKRQCRREREKGINAIVNDLYFPPRVSAATQLLLELRCIPGFALYLTTTDELGRPWDFDGKDTSERARKLVRETTPMLLIGSPMCTAWCAWQRISNLKRDPEVVRKELVRARAHLEFCMKLHAEKHCAGRYFLHDHQAQAASWQEAKVIELLQIEGIYRTAVDQCEYGMEDSEQQPIKKPTSFMTSSKCLAEELSRRCGGENGNCI